MSVPQVKGFFDPNSHTISYVVFDHDSKQSAVIDSVLDFDYASGAISYDLADQILAYIQKLDLDVVWLRLGLGDFRRTGTITWVSS